MLVGGFPDWIPAGFYPLILLVYTMTRLVFPLKQRMGIWVTVFRVSRRLCLVCLWLNFLFVVRFPVCHRVP